MPTIDERRRLTAAKLSALTLANALIFQAELSQADSRVESVRRSLSGLDPVRTLIDHWQFICDTINYVPIFRIAREILLDTPNREEMHRALRELGRHVEIIVAQRAALRHDLMGRIYHKLLLEAKFLGTYYTSVPAATLLAKLTLGTGRALVDWTSMRAIEQLRVADLACGTGTLLMAVQQAVTDSFVRATTAAGESVTPAQLKVLHSTLMEDVLHGYDVLSSAVHLTASTLALLAPEIAFKRTKLVRLPFGEMADGTVNLGSIEFLVETSGIAPQGVLVETDRRASRQDEVPLQLSGLGTRVGGAGLPELDLCIMNPPFTRSVGGNLLFGSLPKAQRRRMQARLRTLLNARPVPILANSTAGLGSVFVAVADKYLKQGGRMSLVLPMALATGVAWEKTRELFSNSYVVDYLVVSHDPERWNFSENTDLSEILVVARKLGANESRGGHRTTIVSLWENTDTPIDALGIAEAVLGATPGTIETGMGIGPVILGSTKRGEMFSLPWAEIRGGQWYPVSFAQTDTVRAAYYLNHGQVFVPGAGVIGSVPVTALSNLALLGPDTRDIHDGFARVTRRTPYPMLLNHDATRMDTLQQEPSAYLEPRAAPLAGRPARRVELLWPRAGRIMIAERLRLNTQRLTACRLPELALSNSWWPTRLIRDDERAEKALVLWLNSTLGILAMTSCRVPTEGPWGKYKKPILERMLVLDTRECTEAQLNALAAAYDALALESLAPIAEMTSDETRNAIDSAICLAFGLGSLRELRISLASEPVVCGLPLGIELADVPEQIQLGL